MDIFDKALEVWNDINDPVNSLCEKKFIFDNEYIGKENNCLSCVPKSIMILDGELNQLHIVKNRSDGLFHQTILMTPQPMEKFSKMELSPNKLFVALIGKDSVSLIEICSLTSTSKAGTLTCKKIKEIFGTKDVIIDVKWYPKLNDYIVILTTHSINIFNIRSGMNYFNCYQFSLHEEIDCLSKSFGIKEEYVGFDFGTDNENLDANIIYILKDSGDVYLLPGLKMIQNNERTKPQKLLFDPPSLDNYQDDFTSIIVLRGSLDILVLANRFGTVQHGIFINNKICVYETISMQISSDQTKPSDIYLQADETAYPPRYFIIQSTGIKSCILPWAVRLRLAITMSSSEELEKCLSTAGSTVFDYILKTKFSENDNCSKVKFGGLSVVRRPSVTPELYIIQCREKKMFVNLKMRQESSVMIKENLLSNFELNKLTSQESVFKDNIEGKFLTAFKAELSNIRKLPILASCLSGEDESDRDKLLLVLQMNDIVSEYGVHLLTAGNIFDHRLKQISTVIKLQKDQLETVIVNIDDLKKNNFKISERFERALSRQENLFKRLSECTYKIAELNGVSPKADKDSTNIILNVQKQMPSMNALLRSCRLRYTQSEAYIDKIKMEEPNKMKSISISDNLRISLLRMNDDINQLASDVKDLMRI